VVNSVTQLTRNPARQQRCVQTTLLELVRALTEVTRDEHEIVATVLHMVREKRVQLNGSFQDRDLFGPR
jgi:predicted nucleic-acid-binding protein